MVGPAVIIPNDLPRHLHTMRFHIRQLRIARERRHLARRQLLPLAQDDLLDSVERVGWNTTSILPQMVDAQHLTAAVATAFFAVLKAHEDTSVQIQCSVTALQKLLASCELAASAAISHSIAIRMDTLSRLRALQTQASKKPHQGTALGHFYRGLVRAASSRPETVNAAIYAAGRRDFLLLYQQSTIGSLNAQILADAQDSTLDTIDGFDAVRFRKRMFSISQTITSAIWRIKKASHRLGLILHLEAGRDGLGFLHMNHAWGTPNQPLQGLRILTIKPVTEVYPRHFLSRTKLLLDLHESLSSLYCRVQSTMKDLNRLLRRLGAKAEMAGRAGALDPFSNSIRKQTLDDLKASYRKEPKSKGYKGLIWLKRWGYRPSPWCRRLWNMKKASSRMSRRKRRLQARTYSEALAAQFHVTYHWVSGKSEEPRADAIDSHAVTNGVGASENDVRPFTADHRAANDDARAFKIVHPRAVKLKTRIRKILHSRKSKRVVISRVKSRKKRGIALQKLRRMLSATLLSCETRTFQDLRSVDLLASLPKGEKPSDQTQIGKTISALGFYDRLGKEPSSWSRKMEPLKNDTGKHFVRWSSSKARPRREPAVLRSPFQATQPMRAPHSTSTFHSSGAWEPSVLVTSGTDSNGDTNANTNADANADTQEGTSGDATKDEDSHIGSGGNHDPNHANDPPDGQGSPPPDDSMDRRVNDESSNESEHEEESESEADEDSDVDEPEEEHIPLAYQIPCDVLKSALQARPQTRASYWSQKLYRGPESQELLLHYCLNMEVSERVAKHFLNEKVVGFDVEWKPFGSVDSIKENASLIQLATEDRIALFHIARFPGKTPEQLMPPSLKIVLESSDTYKVGVAVKGDCSRLEKYFDLKIRGVFELSRLHNLVEYYEREPSKVNNKLVKLATQVQQHLLLPLHKGESFVDEPQQRLGSVRESDWSRPLDVEQIHYAADDAYAGFRLFDVMESKRKKLKPTPPIPRLCDYDNKPVPRVTPRAKRTKQATPELQQVVAESLSGLQAEDTEEEAYETAAEELVEQDESEDTESEAGSESSEDEDPNADYVPGVHGRVASSPHVADASAPPVPSAHRVGRVGFGKLTGDNTSSDESEAFDPPPNAPRRRPTTKAVRAAEAAESEDEFPDSELEEAFAKMNFIEPPKSTEDSVAASAPQAETSAVEERPLSTGIWPPTFAPLIPTDTVHTSEYTLATIWAQDYLSSTIPSPTSTSPSRIRATVSPLRAYHIWHHQRVPLDAVGAHLRSPALAQSTVSSYIIQAISMEKLEYRDEDLISLMATLPANLRLGRYGWLSRKLGIAR